MDKTTEAIRIGKRLKRMLESVPEEFTVIITNRLIQICDTQEFDDFVNEHGHIDDVPVICYTLHGNRNIVGNTDQL